MHTNAKVIIVYAVLSVLGLVLLDTHPIFSLALGPSEHLSLGINTLKNALQPGLGGQIYVDANHVEGVGIHFVVWLLGAGMAIWCFRKSNWLKILILTQVWIAVGVYNLWLFAIRSV